MASPKRAKDQVTSFNQAVISNEIQNSNLTASLSLGNVQRKSWMSGSQTPFAIKFNPSKTVTPRVKNSKATQRSDLPEQTKSHGAEHSDIAPVENAASAGSKQSESSTQAFQSVTQPPKDTAESLPIRKGASSGPTQPEQSSKQTSADQEGYQDLRGQCPEDVVSSTQSKSDQFQEDERDKSSDLLHCQSMHEADISSSGQDVTQPDSPSLLVSESNLQLDGANKMSYDALIQEHPTSPQPFPTDRSTTVGMGRRPSNLLIPPIRRPSLDLGLTPPSGSSDAQSPFDYSVPPTPTILTSPATELSPSGWSGALKRVHDAQPELGSSKKRHQPPATVNSDLAFWDSLNAAFKAQSQGDGSNIRRMMKQCETTITEKILFRSKAGPRGDIEQPRLDLLRKACRVHDYSFLMIHQLFCYSGIASMDPTASRLDPEDRKALSILNTFLASNSDLHQSMVIWFSKFPGTSPAVKSETNHSADVDLWYRAALSTVHGIAARWAGPRGLHSVCMTRRFPPLISEMQDLMNVYSRVLQEVIFTAMLRNLMPAQDPRFAQHERVFKRDLQISWGLGGEDVNTGMSCADEHLQISISSFPPAGSSSITQPSSILAVIGSSSHQAGGDGFQTQSLRQSNIPQGATPAMHYNPQVMWPKAMPSGVSSLRPQSSRRFSAQMPTTILPSNDTTREQLSGERHRHQSVSNIFNPNPLISRNDTTDVLQQPTNANPAFPFLPSDYQIGRMPLSSTVRNQNPLPSLHSSQTRQSVSQASPIAVINPYFDQYSLSQSTPANYSQYDASRHSRSLQWQNYDPGIALSLQASPHAQQRNQRSLSHLQHLGSSQMPNDKMRAVSPKLDTGTHERCFRYVKHIHKPVDILHAGNTQYQQEVLLSQSDIDARARDVKVERVMTTLLYPGSLTFRVRCLKIPLKKQIRTDEDWVCAEQYWPMSIALLFNDKPLSIQRKSAHGKDLPVDITSIVRVGVNTLSVATFNMPKNSPDQYVVGIEAIETVTYTQIKNFIQALPLEAAKKRITSKMASEDPDIEILDPSITVDLTDPFSSIIFTTPARGVSCSHDQCFDLDTFLSTRMGSGGSKNGPCPPEEFKCPICKGDARPSKIVVDDFLRQIRARLEQMDRLDAKAVKLDIDGNWVIKEEVAPANDSPGEDNHKTGFASPTDNMTPRPSISGQTTWPAQGSKPIEIIDLD